MSSSTIMQLPSVPYSLSPTRDYKHLQKYRVSGPIEKLSTIIKNAWISQTIQ